MGLIAAMLAPTAAYADPGDPNPNIINWNVFDDFTGPAGNDIPLRYGQHDHPDQDGFGKYHIEDGHGMVPDHEDIQETVGTSGYCVPAPDDRVICTNTEFSLVVVYATHVDARSGDGRPFGIITAYYFLPCFQAAKCPSPEPPAKVKTTLAYTGPGAVVNGSSARLSARLTNEFGTPVQGRSVRFTLGSGDAAQQCTGTTAGSGTATCTVTEVDQPPGTGRIALTASFAGDSDYHPSRDAAELGITTPTKLAYTGDRHIANGTSARLAARLSDHRDTAVPGRTVEFTLGSGDTAQRCTGTTSGSGTATCTVDSVDQPLNADATVPLTASFAGDASFLASETSAELRLQYATGRAYGLSADAKLGPLPLLDIEPQPDTGRIRTARGSTTSTPCAARFASPLLTVEKLCPRVVTTLAPGTVTATATVAHARIGLPGLPLIEISGLTSTTGSSCTKATGSTTLDLEIAGEPVAVPTAPNSEVPLAGGARLIVNEQKPVSGADAGKSVNGVRLVLAGGAGDLVLGSAESAVHHCGG
ncbi:choice-of-anchor P family protein [Streptomyces meridianus]|uniref:choice-of-anchor P family protein n=1 Tax=Streptomyces meridianus TaxID=2938945 RepID=UPI0020401A75|nr:choice-of-anchor P family protein [Streptomyces meridianus]